MRLLSLALENFGPFTTRQYLPLEHLGLVSVLGLNLIDVGLDANGVGKSSILDGLMWGLTGETSPRKDTATTAAGLKGDDVVNERAGKDCIVEVRFEDDAAKEHRVTRWRKAAPHGGRRGNGVVLEEYVDGEWRTVSGLDAGEVQRRIDALLGMDRSLLGQTVVRAQEDSGSFAQATPKERFALLTQIEGVEELDDWTERFRARHREVTHETARLTGHVAAQRNTIAVLHEEDARVVADAQRWEADRGTRVEAARNRVSLAQKSAESAEQRAALRPQLEQRLAQLEAQVLEVMATTCAPDSVKGLAEWEAHAGELGRALGRLEAERAALARERAGFAQVGEGECPTCRQRVSADHIRSHVDKLAEREKQIDADVASTSAQLVAAQKVITDFKASFEQHRAALAQQRAVLEQERGQITAQLHQARHDEHAAAHARQAVVQAQQALESEMAAANPFTARHGDRITQLEADLSSSEASLAALETEAGLLEWWIKAVPSLKAWIFDNVVGELTAEANRWLTMLTGGLCWVQIEATTTTKSGDVRDKVALRCFKWNADGSQTEREFRRWSGGEKRRIALAVDWAIAQRLSQRARSRCSFLALDEVDRHLDAAGRAGLLVALDHLRREKETVLIVTHDPEFKAAPDVKWVVTKDAHGSRVEVKRGQGQQDEGQEAKRVHELVPA